MKHKRRNEKQLKEGKDAALLLDEHHIMFSITYFDKFHFYINENIKFWFLTRLTLECA